MKINVIIGNLCSVGAMICDAFSGTRKSKKEILVTQSFSQIFYIISSVVLKGYSATVQNVVAIFRNIFAAQNKKNKIIEITFTILPVILGIYFNNRGIIGFLPVLANFQYSVMMFVAKDDITKLKYSFVLNTAMFCVFNFYILNFVGGIFNLFVVTSTIISIFKNRKITNVQ